MRTNEAEILQFLRSTGEQMEGWQLFSRMGGVTHEEWFKFSRMLISMRTNGILATCKILSVS